jgi:AAA15 family ATPase/GTPase
MVMIRRFGVKNFFCFKEGIDVSFEFDGNVPQAISGALGVSSVIGIKGSNGSGKTNIIKALQFLRSFCYNSADLNADDNIDIDAYYHNSDPTEFYVDFEIHNIKYHYEVELTKNGVLREAIYRTSKRKTRILEREGDTIVFAIDSLKEIEMIQLRSNASIISIIRKYKFRSPMDDLHRVGEFFFRILTNVNKLGYRDIELDFAQIARDYANNPSLFDFVKQVVIAADSGIKDIQIRTRKNHNDEAIFYPLFVHQQEGQDKLLTILDESSGTKALFRRMHMYWAVLSTGGLLALDEFDIHIHAMILPKIIGLFMDPNSNPHHAQFIFTAHNTEIIDTLGKYRTILVNKEDNESYCYRLDEIGGSMIRNDRSIVPLYLQGKLGGVPADETV